MVELADALDSGSSVHKDVRVRIPPSAPEMKARREAGYNALRFFYKYKYDALLNGLRLKEPRWKEWILFFLNSSIRQAEKYIDKLVAIESLYNSLIDFAENRKISRDAILYIFNKPVFMINGMKEELGVSYNTAGRYTNELVKAG